MIPTARQNLILRWLSENASLTIDDLSKRLEVSPMTVHRDLDTLARAGQVVKVHGGVALAEPGGERRAVDLCQLCDRPVPTRSAFAIRQADGTTVTACCPHCGFLLLETADVRSVLATDFLYGRTINAAQAAYLVESQVSICCLPSVLTFATADDARRFQLGFGGDVMTFAEARRYLAEHHRNLEHPHSSH